MTIYRLCGCGAKHQHPSGRCDECRRRYERERHRPPTPYTPEYKRAARAHLDRWVATHGAYCPGDPRYSHAGHPCGRHDLTIEHIIPLSAGGSLMDTTNWSVLCRSVNSKTGVRRA